MGISAQEVKKLRDMTNAGMMDCKKALVKADGDMDAALTFLKEKGLADAKKRGDRDTNEGVIVAKASDKLAAIGLFACETDFVGNNEVFQNACNDIISDVVETGNTDIESYAAKIQEVITQTKENVQFKELSTFELDANKYAATYIHGNKKIGVLVLFELGDSSVKEKPEFADMANNISMHIAANAPSYLKPEEVEEKELAEQKSIALKQLEGQGKPQNILDNIIEGKLKKYKSEICLLEQKYIKDDKISVAKYVENTAKELGTDIKLTKFTRFSVGA